ncbi:MAG: MBOAT family protein, partial [Bacteroidetes bacterium]|nr:MBOAT family protein [Bacteroidota bacterium]
MAFVPVYILILFSTILIDYIAGILIENSEGTKRKRFLIISIVANLGILVFFKYANFLSSNINAVFHIANINAQMPLMKILLPVG